MNESKKIVKKDNITRLDSFQGIEMSHSSKTILVVEDEEINRKILKRILEAKDFFVMEAKNGQIALDMLLNNHGGISLVLLDLTMPVMNGYELLAEMKKKEILATTPVIVMTGSENDDAEIKSLKSGASDFITKPYDAEIVCHRVESILRLCDNVALINRLEIDKLTGVYSREAFYRHAEIFLTEHPNAEYDIICSDIENFKMVNSRYGTKTGDEILQYFANYNLSTIGSEGVCGRLGSDIFVVLRKRLKLGTQSEVGKKLEKIFENAPVKNLSIQYGVYCIHNRKKSVADMCDCAQMALSSIKHTYGVYYALYDDSIRQKMLREHQLTAYMEQALVEKQFVVYLQPKHDAKSSAISGAEALVRWIHPELGFIAPNEFIPLFEKNSFITKLDLYVWDAVCSIIHGWIKHEKRIVPVSVNVSRIDFATENLAGTICALVDSYRIPHNMIHFEVTESAYTDNPQQIISAVSEMRSMGFLIEMDDFGAGYSSLNMLSELPIDILKLDMKFMQNSSEEMQNAKRSILSFVISLSKWLQLPTIAEGVETEAEVKLLKAMGCNFFQGYFFAKPMSVDDFEKYMTEIECHENCNIRETTDEKKSETVSLLHSGSNILIVEDIECNREVLNQMLTPYYNVATVNNGQEAYEYIKLHHDELSCILLDLLMPVMDGFQLLDCMRKDGYLDQIPVIITSEAGTDNELRALHLGADGLVSKPYNPEIMLHHVKKAVNEHDFRRLVGIIK